MALAISLYSTSDFYINDIQVKVERIYHSKRYKLKVIGKSIDKIYEITDRNQTEILPNVRVSAGDNVDITKEVVKAVIDAPLTLKILRGKLWREAEKEKANAEAE